MKNRTLYPYTKLDADYVDLRLLLQSVLERKWLILAISLLLSTLSVIYAELKPVRYQASILLKIQHEQQNVLGAISNPNQQLGMTNHQVQPLPVQIALMQSELILRPVIKSLGLDIVIKPDKEASRDFNITEMQVPAALADKPLRLVIDRPKHYKLYAQNGSQLLQGVDGELAGNDAISLKIDNINVPAGSQYTLQKAAEFGLLNKIRNSLTITDLSGASDADANKMAVLRVTLTGTDPVIMSKILNQIAISTQQENIKLKKSDAEKTLAFLYQQLPIVKQSLKEAENKLNIYRASSGRIDVKYQTQYLLDHLTDINKQLELLHLKKSSLLQTYTPNHPTVIAVMDEIKQLSKNREQFTVQLKNAPEYEQDVSTLTREVTIKNDLYTLLLNQIHQLLVIKNGIASDIQILSPASAPTVIQPVKLSVLIILSFVAGLILCALGILISKIFLKTPPINENNKVTALFQYSASN